MSGMGWDGTQKIQVIQVKQCRFKIPRPLGQTLRCSKYALHVEASLLLAKHWSLITSHSLCFELLRSGPSHKKKSNMGCCIQPSRGREKVTLSDPQCHIQYLHPSSNCLGFSWTSISGTARRTNSRHFPTSCESCESCEPVALCEMP